MLHKNHIIRRAAVSFASVTVLTALAGADVVPAHAASRQAPSSSSSASSSVPAVPVPGVPVRAASTRAVTASLTAAVAPRVRTGSGVRPLRRDSGLSGAEIFQGRAFDTCHTPSSSVMRAWHGTSPFGAVGVYIGGRGRACPSQPNLTSSWVRSVDRMGWKVLPLYVGSQSPCVDSARKRRYAMSHTAPAERGGREGRDAVAAAEKLGMARHSAVYLDMESYDNDSTRCAATTLRFIQGWNRAVRKADYLPGLYSSSNSGIAHMNGARRAGRKDLPEALWFADWKAPASVSDNEYLDAEAWQPHRRIHQYDGNVTRTYGGRRLNLDRNLVDAPVAVVP